MLKTETHCVNGHELNDETRYVYPDGIHASCRVCTKEATQRYRKRQGPTSAAQLRADRAERGVKWCPRCAQELPLEKFGTNPGRRDGRAGYCSACDRAYQRQYTFGLTPEAYEGLLEGQGGGCALCGGTTRLAVDHCHDTGVVRGILCISCNVSLGQLGESIESITRVLAYLTQGGASSSS